MRIFLYAFVAALAFGLTDARAGTTKIQEWTVERAMKEYGSNARTTTASFHNSGSKSLYHTTHPHLPKGTILIVERSGKQVVVVVVNGVGGKSGRELNLSAKAAEVLGIKKVGLAKVSYRVVAWPTKPAYMKGLTEDQLKRILKGEDASTVVPGAISATSAPPSQKESTGEETKPVAPEKPKETPPPAVEKPKVEVKPVAPVVKAEEPKNDLKRNHDPGVLASVEFAAKVVGTIHNLPEAEVALVTEALIGVCGIESKCNPTFVHYTPSGGVSQYQGIGQMDWSEMKRAHKTLKEMATQLPEGQYKDQLERLIAHFDSVVSKASPPKKFIGDPRFDAAYGPLLLMALHAKTAEGKNLILAALRSFPAKNILGQAIFYKITPEGVVPDSYGDVSPTQVHVAVIQSGQLNPGGLVGENGEVNLTAPWTLTPAQNKANDQLLFQWIVKPKDGAGDAGVLMPNGKAPKTKGEAIARIIKNSEARYHVSRAVLNEEYREGMWKLFISTTTTYAAAWEALSRDPLNAELEQAYKIAENALAEKGWAVRSLLRDPGKTLYERSGRADSFREYLAKFRITHYQGTSLKFTDKMRQQLWFVENMRLLAEEQINPVFAKQMAQATYVPLPEYTIGEVRFSVPWASDAEAKMRAEYLVSYLKKENPDISDSELSAQLVFYGLESTEMFKNIRERLALALLDGDNKKKKVVDKDALVRANSEIGKEVAILMKIKGPILSFSKNCIGMISEQCIVDDYLWEAYQRMTIRIDSAGDFTWKDITGALNAGMSLREYVVGGMAWSIKISVYFTGKAMDAQGVAWGPLAYYRGLERPPVDGTVAARPINSKHYNGGYGKGIASDLAGIVRAPQAARWESDNRVWAWLRMNGKVYGLRTHFIGNDPAHVQPSFDQKILNAQEFELRRLVIEMKKMAGTNKAPG